jgi:hypothetical protein
LHAVVNVYCKVNHAHVQTLVDNSFFVRNCTLLSSPEYIRLVCIGLLRGCTCSPILGPLYARPELCRTVLDDTQCSYAAVHFSTLMGNLLSYSTSRGTQCYDICLSNLQPLYPNILYELWIRCSLAVHGILGSYNLCLVNSCFHSVSVEQWLLKTRMHMCMLGDQRRRKTNKNPSHHEYDCRLQHYTAFVFCLLTAHIVCSSNRMSITAFLLHHIPQRHMIEKLAISTLNDKLS